MAKILDVEGIGPEFTKRLSAIGIKTTNKLLKMGAKPKDREELAQKSGISEKLLLEWINHADLFRIKGVGEEYSDLLEEAGVDTVPELAQRNPENLYATMKKTNQDKKLVRQLPSLRQVTDWVQQAKSMDRKIHY